MSPALPVVGGAEVIAALGTIGEDREVQERAASLYAQFEDNPEKADRDLAPALVGILAHAGGGNRYEEFKRKFKAARTPQEEQRYLFSLADFRDKVLLFAQAGGVAPGAERFELIRGVLDVAYDEVDVHAVLVPLRFRHGLQRESPARSVTSHQHGVLAERPDMLVPEGRGPEACEAVRVGAVEYQAQAHRGVGRGGRGGWGGRPWAGGARGPGGSARRGPGGRGARCRMPLTTVGRPGVQVGGLTRRPQGYFITHVEGAKQPSVNGQSIGAAPHMLKDHDVIEIAGVKMEYFLKS